MDYIHEQSFWGTESCSCDACYKLRAAFRRISDKHGRTILRAFGSIFQDLEDVAKLEDTAKDNCLHRPQDSNNICESIRHIRARASICLDCLKPNTVPRCNAMHDFSV